MYMCAYGLVAPRVGSADSDSAPDRNASRIGRQKLRYRQIQHLGKCDERVQAWVGGSAGVRFAFFELAIGVRRDAGGVREALLAQTASHALAVKANPEFASILHPGILLGAQACHSLSVEDIVNLLAHVYMP